MRNQGWRESEKRELIVAWSRHGGSIPWSHQPTLRGGGVRGHVWMRPKVVDLTGDGRDTK